MEYDAIWQAFRRTGDPVYYLLYRQINESALAEAKDKGPGDSPQPMN